MFCQLFGYTKQAYYKQCKTHENTRLKERLILDHILQIRRQMPRLGVRKLYYLTEPMLDTYGIKYGRDKLFDLLGREDLLIKKRRKYTKTTNSKHWMRKYPNLIKDITPTRPEQIWVADITYVSGDDGHNYLHLITDAYSKQIMGHELCPNLEASSTLKALKVAIAKRQYPKKSLIHHSDRGLQYCSKLYTDILKDNHIQISMTENGDPYENAVAERLNGILKDEFDLGDLPGEMADIKKQAAQSIHIYNQMRPHLSCEMLTPVQMHAQEKIRIKTWRNKKASNNLVIT